MPYDYILFPFYFLILTLFDFIFHINFVSKNFSLLVLVNKKQFFRIIINNYNVKFLDVAKAFLCRNFSLNSAPHESSLFMLSKTNVLSSLFEQQGCSNANDFKYADF